MEAEIIEPEPTFRLRLIRASDDPPLGSQEYQKEIAEFAKSLRAQGVKVSTRHFARNAVGGGGGLSGEFICAVAAPGFLAKKLDSPLRTFLKGHFARKARVEFREDGTLKTVEAQNVDEADKLINAAAKYQKKVSHE
jgi:hypothetical protein